MYKGDEGVKIGLALGSGGARGIAHVALLEKMEGAGIKPSIIVGASAGAVVGALYCLYGLEEVLERAIDIVNSNSTLITKAEELLTKKRTLKEGVLEMSKIVFAHSLLAGDVIYDSLKRALGSKKFSDCRTKFAAVAFDIVHAKPVIIDEGFILDAVVASSSVPGTFPPVRLGGMYLVDGGTTRVVPTREARELGADYVVASDVSPFKPEVSDTMSVLYTVDDVKGRMLADMDLAESDVAVRFDIPNIHWYEFGKLKIIYKMAEKELEDADFHSVLKEQKRDAETSSA